MANIPWKTKQRDSGRELSPLTVLRQEMDRLLDTFVREPLGSVEWPFGERAWSPVVDVAETEKEVIVRAEVPGVEPSDLDITVTGNQLVLSGEKREATDRESKGLLVSESHYGSFRRSVPLPAAVDTTGVSAEHLNGVLTIRLPKTQAAATQRIEVKVK